VRAASATARRYRVPRVVAAPLLEVRPLAHRDRDARAWRAGGARRPRRLGRGEREGRVGVHVQLGRVGGERGEVPLGLRVAQEDAATPRGDALHRQLAIGARERPHRLREEEGRPPQCLRREELVGLGGEVVVLHEVGAAGGDHDVGGGEAIEMRALLAREEQPREERRRGQ
jgi:hypothetical protein